MDIINYSPLYSEFKKGNEDVKLLEIAVEAIKPNVVARYMTGYSTKSLSKATKDLDAQYWRDCFKITGLSQYMDAEEIRRLEESIQSTHVPFTEENVRETLTRVAGEAEHIFLRGVFNLFKFLSKNYRSHDAFKVNKKMIMNYMWSDFGNCINHGNAENQINDLDRCLKTLQGKLYKPYKLINEINSQAREGFMVIETDDFTIKRFKNQNAHIIFKDLELLEKVNQLISKYAENTLAKAS